MKNGIKYDEGKNRLDIPMESIWEIGRVFTIQGEDYRKLY